MNGKLDRYVHSVGSIVYQNKHKYKLKKKIVLKLLDYINKKLNGVIDEHDLIIIALVDYVKKMIDPNFNIKQLWNSTEYTDSTGSQQEKQNMYNSISKLNFDGVMTVFSASANGRYSNDFDEIKKIGNGGFGTVFETTNRFDGVTYAIKKIPIDLGPTCQDQYFCEMFNEAKILAQLSHPNIIRYYSTWIETIESDVKPVDSVISVKSISEHNKSVSLGPYVQFESIEKDPDQEVSDFEENVSQINSQQTIDNDTELVLYEPRQSLHSIIYIQMELCQTTLDKYIQNNVITKSMIMDMLNAIKYIHSRSIIHCDLSLNNFLVGLDSTVKLCDFGLAENLGSKDHVIKPTICGTPMYTAPESFKSRKYSYATDIYSLGIVLFELINRFGTDMERITMVDRFKKLDGRAGKMHPLLLEMVNPVESFRPNIDRIILRLYFDLEHQNDIKLTFSKFVNGLT